MSCITENPETSIHFWAPCHATPYYSYLHQNVSMWFPDCSPVYVLNGHHSNLSGINANSIVSNIILP